MPRKLSTSIKVTERPGPFGVIIETTPFKLRSSGTNWIGKEMVNYWDDVVDISIATFGQMGQSYKVTISLNKVDKEISGSLKKDGQNRINKTIPLQDFNL